MKTTASAPYPRIPSKINKSQKRFSNHVRNYNKRFFSKQGGGEMGEKRRTNDFMQINQFKRAKLWQLGANNKKL